MKKIIITKWKNNDWNIPVLPLTKEQNMFYTKQNKINRRFSRNRNIYKLKNIILFLLFVLIFVLIILIYLKQSYSYQYKNTLSAKDYTRTERIETCKRVWIVKLWNKLTKKHILHCATMNTIITAIESNYMKSRKCIQDNNCKWLKWIQNWKYTFLVFTSLYKQNLFFAEKWFTYHYKKTFFTLVYGYKQQNGLYKFWWTTTDRAIYLKFIKNKYFTIKQELLLLY